MPRGPTVVSRGGALSYKQGSHVLSAIRAISRDGSTLGRRVRALAEALAGGEVTLGASGADRSASGGIGSRTKSSSLHRVRLERFPEKAAPIQAAASRTRGRLAYEPDAATQRCALLAPSLEDATHSGKWEVMDAAFRSFRLLMRPT